MGRSGEDGLLAELTKCTYVPFITKSYRIYNVEKQIMLYASYRNI